MLEQIVSKPLMSLNKITEALQDKRLYVIARKLDLSYPTIKKIADGKDKNYSYNTIKKLSEYLSPNLNIKAE